MVTTAKENSNYERFNLFCEKEILFLPKFKNNAKYEVKDVCLVINTPKAKRNYAEDRKACLKYKVSYITTIAGALAAVKGIESVKHGNGGEGGVKSLQKYHAMIK